jgi:GNAT superfamily N-acetyltransferase
VLNAIGRRGVWRVSRLVVLPDYQGIGIGRAMLAAVARLYPRLRITTSHPAVLRALAADPTWRLAAFRRAGYTRQIRATEHASFHGGHIAATSAGRCVGTFEKQ